MLDAPNMMRTTRYNHPLFELANGADEAVYLEFEDQTSAIRCHLNKSRDQGQANDSYSWPCSCNLNFSAMDEEIKTMSIFIIL